MNRSLARILPFATGLLIGITSSALAESMRGSALFHDVQPGSSADEAIGELSRLGILQGDSDGNFRPGSPVTREELASSLYKLLRHLENTPGEGQKNEKMDVKREKRQKNKGKEQRKRQTQQSDASLSKASAPGETGAGAFRFATESFSIIEKAKSITVSVVRIGGTAGTASVMYEVIDDSTTRGNDYVPSAGTLTFGNGESTKFITVPLKDDNDSEGTERLRITLKNAQGSAIGSPAEVTVNLLDDEAGNFPPSSSSTASTSAASFPTDTHSVTFSTGDYSVHEKGGSATITVTRSGNTAAQSTVDYETQNGTASAGAEYTAMKGTLSFAPGETTKTFTIPITDNQGIEGTKTVKLLLKNPGGGFVIGSPGTALLTIVDDEVEPFDAGSFKFSKPKYDIGEGEASATITILRMKGSTGTATVDYATNDGSALAGSDYTLTKGTLTFAEGEASKSFIIPMTKDTNALEVDETLTITLSNQAGGTKIIDPTSVTLTIRQ